MLTTERASKVWPRALSQTPFVMTTGSPIGDRDEWVDECYWTGWSRELWPVRVIRPGLLLYIFDTRYRRVIGLVRLVEAGTFRYRTRNEFRRGVNGILPGVIGRDPHPHFLNVPIAASGARPCVGLACGWNLVRKLDVEVPGLKFPQTGWISLDLDAVAREAAKSVPDSDIYYAEGDRKMRTHLAIERSRRLRSDALAYWKAHGGIHCRACGFDFEEAYGFLGRNFVELHHRVEISSKDAKKKARVIDLVPVCSNCHRMLHKERPALSLTALRARISARRRNRSAAARP